MGIFWALLAASCVCFAFTGIFQISTGRLFYRCQPSEICRLPTETRGIWTSMEARGNSMCLLIMDWNGLHSSRHLFPWLHLWVLLGYILMLWDWDATIQQCQDLHCSSSYWVSEFSFPLQEEEVDFGYPLLLQRNASYSSTLCLPGAQLQEDNAYSTCRWLNETDHAYFCNMTHEYIFSGL